MLNPRYFENSRPDGIAVLEIPHQKNTPDTLRFVPLKQTVVGGMLLGPLAALNITHVYGYTREQCSQVLEALYRFPLPGDAAVTGVVVHFGGVEIRAELKERKQAEADYDEAKQQGKQAALVTRESPDVFTLRVAGIKPDQDITVETSYVHLAQAEGVSWSLRIPMTTAPRFTRSDERSSTPANAQPLALMRDPQHRFSLDILFPHLGRIQSQSFSLEVTDEDGCSRVQLSERSVIPDRDIVLTWTLEQENERPALRVLTHDDVARGFTYFLALVAPPAVQNLRSSVPREAILLVDHSGSMEGAKWKAADWAVEKFLVGLSPQDEVALGLFHSETKWFAKNVQSVTAKEVAELTRFLKGNKDSGGTQLGVALEQALSLARSFGDKARHVLVITDAEVTDFGRLLRLAEDESRRSDRRRISMLCIDSAPNAFLAMQVAQKGGGVAKFLTSDPHEGDITTALDIILADWTQPILANLRLEVDRAGVQGSGRDVCPGRSGESSALDLGDLPAGRAVWVVGRVPIDQSVPEFRVTTSDGQVVASATGEPIAGNSDPAFKALFGAWRVLGLEALVQSGSRGSDVVTELISLGYDPQTDLARWLSEQGKIYEENQRDENFEALNQLLMRESLDYGLLSSVTGFVAVRSEAGQLVEYTVAVGNALPQGWSESQILMRRGMVAGSLDSSAMIGSASEPPFEAYRSRTLRPYVHSKLNDEAQDSHKSRSFDDIFKALGLVPRTPKSAKQSGATVGMLHFEGTPRFETNMDAVLIDAIAHDQVFTQLEVIIGSKRALDPGLMILVYVDDLSTPVLRSSLADMQRSGGTRPVNLAVADGQRVLVVLRDSNGAWAKNAHEIQVTLR